MYQFLLLLLIVGCGQKTKNEMYTKANEVKKENLSIPSDWKEEELAYDQMKDIRVIRYQMPNETLELERSRYRETDLKEYPLPTEFNTKAFLIENFPLYKDKLFIGPKVWVYGQQEKSRIIPTKNSDGSINITFPVILVDGLSSEVTDHRGESLLKLPYNLQVHQADLLKNNSGKELAVLPGCLKRVVINFEGEEYDVTPYGFRQADYCEIAKPFRVTLRLPERKARFFLEKALYAAGPEIKVIYETQARLTKSKVVINFNREKIYKEIQTKLKLKYVWAETDMNFHLREIFKNQLINVSVVGDVTDILDKLIQHAISEFMQPFTPTQPQEMEDCQSGGKISACFKLSYEKFSEKNEFKLEINESEAIFSGQRYVTFAPLKAITDKASHFGTRENPLPYLHKRETGLTVIANDLIELRATGVFLKSQKLSTPIETIEHHPVCLERKIVKICQNNSNPREGRDLICHEEDQGCLREQDQYKKIITYSTQEIQSSEVLNPLQFFNSFVEGLYLNFSWFDRSSQIQKDLSCPLSTFNYEADGETLFLRMEDQENCNPFALSRGSTLMLKIENKLTRKIDFLSGRYVENYQGIVLERPREVSENSPVSIMGNISIRGYQIYSM